MLTHTGPLASLAALIFGVVLLGGAPSPAQETELDALVTRALALHQSGDLEGAAALYVQILRAVPGAAHVRSNLGAAWASLGRYEDAIDQYRQALRQIDEASIRRNLALALLKTGQVQEAAVEAERALVAQPGDRDALLLLADCRLRLGETQGAIDVLKPAAAASPDDKAIAYLLGTALLEANRTGEAQLVMDRVFRGDSPESHVLLGSMYARRNEWPAALAEYQKARSASPKLPLVNFLYGEALMKERNDWAGAAAAFRAELAIDPNHYESNLLLGTLLREGGQTDEALPRLEHAARLRGEDLAVKFSLGAAYLATGRMAEAERLLEQVAAAAPGHLPTQMQLAVLYTRLGRPEDAATARRRVVRLTKEADARSFQGVRESISDLIGKSGAPADAASASAVRGTLVVKGAKTNADAVVTLEAPGLELAPPVEPLKIDQKGFRFIPHVLVIQTGSTIRFLNNDRELHNVYSPEGRYNLGTWPTGATKDYTFKRSGIYSQLCNLHPDMLAYVVVVDTPHFAVTDATGAFLIRDVPAGKYKLVAWHEQKDGLEQEVEVVAGKPLKLDLLLEK